MKENKYLSIWLSLTLILVFIAQLLFPKLTPALMLTSGSLNEPWRFLTAIFLHSSVVHLLYNLLSLIFFGFLLEKLIGSTRFFWLFMLSGIFANLISFGFYPASLGASGAIMAVIGGVAVLRPMMMVWAFGMIVPMFVLDIIWTAASVLGIFGFGEPNIGHLAHLSGRARLDSAVRAVLQRGYRVAALAAPLLQFDIDGPHPLRSLAEKPLRTAGLAHGE
jgi:membrane associated rhomboid family serine protease